MFSLKFFLVKGAGGFQADMVRRGRRYKHPISVWAYKLSGRNTIYNLVGFPSGLKKQAWRKHALNWALGSKPGHFKFGNIDISGWRRSLRFEPCFYLV